MSRRVARLPVHIALTAVSAVLLTGCADISDQDRLAEASVRDSMPTQEFDDVTMIQTRDGILQFVLEAPRLERYDKLDQALLYGGIKITFYEDEKVSSVLTAERGEVWQGGNALKAMGNVVVTTDTGTTILTPRMEWDRNTREIVSDTTVTIITDQDTIRGTGLIASDDLKSRQVIEPTGISYRTVRPADSTEVEEAEPEAVAEPDTTSLPDSTAAELEAAELPDTLSSQGSPELPDSLKPGGP